MILLGTATYHLLVNNLVCVGESLGLQIAKNDVDQTGHKISSQFNLNLDATTQITIICYHTSSNILVQLKGNSVDEEWDTKLRKLESFVNNVLKRIVTKIESTMAFTEVSRTISEWVDAKLGGNKQGQIADLKFNLGDHENMTVKLSDVDESLKQIMSGEEPDNKETWIVRKTQKLLTPVHPECGY